MTLEEQHKKFLLENPDIKLTFIEWIRLFNSRTLPENFEPIVSDDFMIGPDGAFEYNEDDMKDWDVTLMDGLEDEPFKED
jgi:hypothetical protein